MSEAEFGYAQTLTHHPAQNRDKARHVMHKIVDAMFDAGVDPMALSVRWEEQPFSLEAPLLVIYTCVATGRGEGRPQSDE